MHIRLNRWQPRANRFRTEKITTEEAKPILELVLARGVPLSTDVSVDQKIMRTQHVDRIVIDTINDTIDVYLSPVVDREYKKSSALKTTETTITKKRGATTCTCHHMEADHSKHTDGRARICLMPGCRCADYQVNVEDSDHTDKHKQATSRPVTESDPINDDDVAF